MRHAAGWFLRNPANLDPDEQRQLDALCATSPQLAALRTHVRHFAEMMTHRRGRQLDAWMTAVLADDLPELHSFVIGLRRDQDAVTAGLSLPYSSGPVEGQVNRIIMWNLSCQAALIGRGQSGAGSQSRTTLLTTGSKPRTGCSWLPPSGVMSTGLPSSLPIARRKSQSVSTPP
ncbi:transposase [Nonomuraea basaltis]|nr:transposase [Nonomuraea basaltis]